MRWHLWSGIGILALFLIIIGISCVKIETGPESKEQRTETSELRARDFRVNWVNRFNPVPPVEKALLLKDLLDSVSVRYLRYGRRVADEWYQGNTGRGQPVPDTEMRQVVSTWNETEQPLLDAYEETVEYSIGKIKEAAFFDGEVIKLLRENIELFYEIRSGVFYPSGTLEDYEDRLDELTNRRTNQSENLDYELSRYH
ncbi:MAG: hypothetical protein JXA92_03200 [candidate division Zixibacteria bacterium]|nr:hypothetical protein [candidate division Zixibacteria bacterium]